MKPLLPFFVLLFILLLAYELIIIAHPLPSQIAQTGYQNVHDLRNIDFDNHIYIHNGCTEIIPDELLTPEELMIDENYDHDNACARLRHDSILTSRTIFLVEDGKWYTFTRRSVDHSHRIYVNGYWLADVGQPGATPETDIPGNGRITFTAQGVDGKIELVQQSTNHFYRYGQPKSHSRWYIGTGTELTNAVRSEDFQTNIILGCFLVLAFLFILLFFTQSYNRAALYFSLVCLVWFARVGTTGSKVFAVLFPQMDWFIRIRIEYLAIPVSAVLTLAIVNALFPKVLHKPALYVMYGVSAIFATLFLFMDTLPMSFLIDWVYIIYGSMIAYTAGCLIIRQFIIRRKINPPQIIFISGLVIFFSAVLIEFGYLPEVLIMPDYQLAGVAMLILALCEASAIFIEAMREREETIEARLNLSNEVAVLENLSQLKTEYYDTLQSHIAETKQARHDLRHHLSVFQSCIDAGDIEKLTKYMDEYRESLPDDTELTLCDNYAVNSILRYYSGKAKKEGISFETHLELPENTGVSDSDLCIIFGNCIENAIEACRNVDGERFIKINSKIVGKNLAVTIDNSFDGFIDENKGTFLSRKHDGEGIGISSVKAVAAKYDATARFEVVDNVFQAMIMLRMAENE